MKKVLLVGAALVFFWGCGVPHIDAYVPKQRNYEFTGTKSAATEADTAGGLWKPDARNAALYSDYRAFREQDLVVVRVEEMADARRSADTTTNRDAEISVALQAFLRAAGTTTNANPQLDMTASAKSGLDFAADGKTGRTERLTATVPAIVKKVLPNGNLFIEGHRVVLVNSEEQHFYISGVVRPIDIAQDNSIRSSYVADAEIEFTGRGVLSDNQKPGLLTRFFNWIWPF
ncbi:MAG: flagellar basal body L-ring protein FlgH [Archangiaceae bacterium]|nr:flagellar basal body L-ring protein FlgH [Archangiaceae bacterium]